MAYGQRTVRAILESDMCRTRAWVTQCESRAHASVKRKREEVQSVEEEDKTKQNNTVKNTDTIFSCCCCLFCGVWVCVPQFSRFDLFCQFVRSLETHPPGGLIVPYNSPSRVYDSHIRRSFRTLLIMFDNLQVFPVYYILGFLSLVLNFPRALMFL